MKFGMWDPYTLQMVTGKLVSNTQTRGLALYAPGNSEVVGSRCNGRVS